MTRYEFNAIKAFLTYAQARPLTKQQVFDHFVAFDKDHIKCKKILVAEEAHEDGEPHYHVFIEFSSKLHSRDARVFDIEGKHPNIQACRSPKRTIAYCLKEDETPLANFEYGEKATAVSIAKSCIEEGRTTNEIVDAILEEHPDLIRSIPSLHAYIERRVAPSIVHVPERSVDDFSLAAADHQRITDWGARLATMVRGDRTHMRSLWLVGPSGVGKTSLARSIGKHWYMQGLWSIDKYSDDEGVYGVLDDIPWDSLKFNYKSLLGRQKDVTWTDKYRPKKSVKFGYPVIVCTNEAPEFNRAEREWMLWNVDFYYVGHVLYDNEGETEFTRMMI